MKKESFFAFDNAYIETETVFKTNGTVITTPASVDIESWRTELNSDRVEMRGKMTLNGDELRFEPNPPRQYTPVCEMKRDFNNIRLRQYPRTKQIVISYVDCDWDDVLQAFPHDAKIARNLILEQSFNDL